MSRLPTTTSFAADVAGHQMTVLHDIGMYRHLRFSRTDTNCGSFNIVTWPGYLAYAGDMGDYTFARIPDMFNFFRGRCRPDFGYWAEKVQAQDKHSGIREYSETAAREWVKECLDEGEAPENVRAAAADLNYGDGEVRLYDEIGAIGWRGFQDHWEANWKEYTGNFVWCCFALPWAIEKYDAAKATVTP